MVRRVAVLTAACLGTIATSVLSSGHASTLGGVRSESFLAVNAPASVSIPTTMPPTLPPTTVPPTTLAPTTVPPTTVPPTTVPPTTAPTTVPPTTVPPTTVPPTTIPPTTVPPTTMPPTTVPATTSTTIPVTTTTKPPTTTTTSVPPTTTTTTIPVTTTTRPPTTTSTTTTTTSTTTTIPPTTTVPAVLPVCDTFSLSAPTGSALNNRPTRPVNACRPLTWTVHSGSWSINSSGLAASGNSTAVATLEGGTQATSATVTVTNAANNSEAGVVINHNGSNTYLAAVLEGRNSVSLRFVYGGLSTTLDTVNVSFPASTSITVTRSGWTLTVKVGTATVMTYNLNLVHVLLLGSGTRVGVWSEGTTGLRLTKIVATP